MQPSDQFIASPRPFMVDRRVKRLPAEVARWLLSLADRPPTAAEVHVLRVSDDDNFGAVVMTPGTWRAISAALERTGSDRYRGLFLDQSGQTSDQQTGGNHG